MTNTNMNLKNRPFLLKPATKDYIWGGNRLYDDFSKEDVTPLAETWECSIHPDGISTVVGGEYDGEKLHAVLKMHPDMLGEHNTELPILVKLIDAEKDMSVQVHPDDEYAETHENGEHGKTEAWYVIDAAEDAHLVYGLHHNIDKESFQKSVADGTCEKYLQRVPVKKNEVYFIEPGTIHSIGAGCLIAEVQESSNVTYRLYDYNRTDKNGKKRDLHIDKGLEVANLNGLEKPRQPLRVLRYKPGCATEMLCRCRHFQMERMLINTEHVRESVPYQTGKLTFEVLLCISGSGMMLFEGDNLRFIKGDCIFIPANSEAIRIHGDATFVRVIC